MRVTTMVKDRAKLAKAQRNRDANAAKVIRAVGLAVQACGDGVRPPRS